MAPVPAMPPVPLTPSAVVDDKYEILERLGAGSFGEVFRVRHRVLQTEMALKTLHPVLAFEPQVRERFLREARILVGLQHPNVVGLHDAGEWRGHLYMAMDLCRGETLSAAVRRRGRIPGREAAFVAARIAAALECAHACGVVHRDLKPANVMLVPAAGGATHVKVLDFGVAKVLHGRSEGDGPSLTALGAAVGTLAYMSPEQAQGQPLDGRSDLYALGVILYQMVTGRRPFDGDSPGELIKRILFDPPPPFGVPGLEEECPGLPALIRAALVKEPFGRPASAAAMRQELERLAAASPDAQPERAPQAVGMPGFQSQETLPEGWQATSPRRPDTVVAVPPRPPTPWVLVFAVAVLGFAGGGIAVWRPWNVEQTIIANEPVAVYRLDLSATPAEGGAVEILHSGLPPSEDEFEAGTEVGLLAVPASGWLFDGWEDGHPGPEKRNWFVRPRENRVVARFRRVPATANVAEDRPADAAADAARAAAEAERVARALIDTQEREACAALASIVVAEADFRSMDRDGNLVCDFWTADVSGLYAFDGSSDPERPEMIRLIDLSVALADDAPAGGTPLVARRPDLPATPLPRLEEKRPRAGYWFRMMNEDLQAAARGEQSAYRHDTDGRGDRARNLARFGVCAFPADYPRSGKKTFIVNEGSIVFWKDTGGAAVEAWPTDADLAREWRRAEEAPALPPGEGATRPTAGGEPQDEVARAYRDAAVAQCLDRGASRMVEGNTAEAMVEFTRALEFDPGNAPAYLLRAGARMRLGDLQGALADLDEALRLDPRAADAYAARASVLLQVGDTDRAFGDLGLALELSPQEASIWALRGSARFQRGDLVGALADLDRAIEIEPLPEFHLERGSTREAMADLDGALEDYAAALEFAAPDWPLRARAEERQAQLRSKTEK